jgi:hypothetical protein
MIGDIAPPLCAGLKCRHSAIIEYEYRAVKGGYRGLAFLPVLFFGRKPRILPEFILFEGSIDIKNSR